MAPMPTTTAVSWNPYKAFQINPERALCAGYAPSMGRDCHNQVAQKWHDEAERIIRHLMSLDPQSVTAEDLDDLAYYLLCAHVHRHNRKGERDALIEKWLRNLQIYLTSPKQTSVSRKPTLELESRLADAQVDCTAKERSLTSAQEISAALTITLEDTQRRLLNKERRCDELQNLNESLLTEKKEKEEVCELYLREKWSLTEQLTEKDKRHQEQRTADQAEIARLKDLLKARDDEVEGEKTANKNFKDTLRHFNKASNEKIAKIATLTQQCSDKEAKMVEVQTKIRSKDDALKQVEQSYKAQVAELKEGNRTLKAKLFLQAFTMSVKHQQLEEVKADKEALYAQHKHLQHAKIEVNHDHHF